MRIVSLLSSATEILFALGLGDQVVAVSHECDYPPATERLPKATRSLVDSSRSSRQIDADVHSHLQSGAALFEMDATLLTRLRPDLIVTQAQCAVCAVRHQDVLDLVAGHPLLAGTQVLALNPMSLAEILADIERVGTATGTTAAAHDYSGALIRRVERVRASTLEIAATERPRVVCLEWLEPLMAAGNWLPELVALAGGESGLAAAGEHSRYVEPGMVQEYDPDVLVVAPCGFNLPRTIQEAQRLLEYSFWNRVSACASGRVFAVDGNAYLNRSGPRIVDSLEILAHLLHPRRVGPPAWAAANQQPWSRLVTADGRLLPV